jgi:bacteriorhodopsin
MALLESSFYVTYVFLLTTGTITFIESLRTDNAVVRHVMNLETCISIVAGYFYSTFVELVKDGHPDYKKINLTRYLDWYISTPLMLFVLCMVLSNEQKVAFTIKTFLAVLLLDYSMLTVGYLGELNYMERYTADLVGFLFFGGMYGLIWKTFLAGGKKTTFGSALSYYTFVLVWLVYGVVYLFDETTKNVCYNVLDLIAKALVGIFFWMYFTKSVKIA